MQDEQDQPMSGAELEAWREQRARDTARRAMWGAWKRLAVWVGAGLIALNAGVSLLREIFGGPPGR